MLDIVLDNPLDALNPVGSQYSFLIQAHLAQKRRINSPSV
ncbi:Uncharacterised protein [Vibrio cholerae]|nr:Uncharacterised protein [Vibrio cholerae]